MRGRLHEGDLPAPMSTAPRPRALTPAACRAAIATPPHPTHHPGAPPAPPEASRSWYPRQDSNLRTRFRKPMLYPLSYGGLG